MTPAAFIQKWSDSQLRERQGSQEHFLDLCRMLGEPTPAEDDPLGERYCFERGAGKTGGGDGWADVWRKGCFGWEYKGKHKNLDSALRQLQAYALDLQNPPYLVVCDMERIIVHTNWTNTVSRKIELTLDDLHEPEKLAVLKLVFQGSESLKPKISPQELTAKVAQRFGDLGRRLQERKHDPREVAHFLNRIVFCMFAEDARLLPHELFTRLMKSMQMRPPAEAAAAFDNLFAMMRGGGMFGADVIKHFNGGLFDDKPALPLERADLKLIADTAGEHDWSEIDPSVFGNMFEEALKATRERAALGAHYTDRAKILKIVDPVITWPLTAEWEAVLAQMAQAMAARDAAEAERKAVLEAAADAMKADPDKARAGEAGRRKALAAAEKRKGAALDEAAALLEGFLTRLAAYRVLDPACGSGNFLYVALHALKDIERRALVDAERLGVPVPAPRVGLQCVRGIEIEDYAAELARVTLWIGDLQWNAKNNYTGLAEPILSSLDQIECRDALLNPDGTEAEWPDADAIVGNPPFLGGRKLKPELGSEYVSTLRRAYAGRVSEGADLVCYWFEKSREQVVSGRASRCGFVATNSISGGSNRATLAAIEADLTIVSAWDDEPWAANGASVRVAMISFCSQSDDQITLNGEPVDHIFSDLTAKVGTFGVDLAAAKRLDENRGLAFQGVVPRSEVNRAEKTAKSLPDASFLMPGEIARQMMSLGGNPHGRPNSDVLRPYLIGDEITTRGIDRYIVDFGDMSLADAALYEAPFKYISPVKLHRAEMKQPEALTNWWRHWNSRPAMRRALKGLGRYIATPRVSKHRLFVWVPEVVLPDCQVVAIASSRDDVLGVLHSRFHELWTLRMCTFLGVGNDPRYTPSTTFDTFPFPTGLNPHENKLLPGCEPVAEAARELVKLRESWLNAPDLAVQERSKRTLTALYNERPAWLALAHERLDAAVACAFGLDPAVSDDDALRALLTLNADRAG